MIKYLTWKDIKHIIDISDKMIEEDINGDLPDSCITEQGYYEEILRRFSETIY